MFYLVKDIEINSYFLDICWPEMLLILNVKTLDTIIYLFISMLQGKSCNAKLLHKYRRKMKQQK